VSGSSSDSAAAAASPAPGWGRATRAALAADPDFPENTIVRGFIEPPEYRGRFGPQ
jgi:hypothetical protein